MMAMTGAHEYSASVDDGAARCSREAAVQHPLRARWSTAAMAVTSFCCDVWRSHLSVNRPHRDSTYLYVHAISIDVEMKAM